MAYPPQTGRRAPPARLGSDNHPPLSPIAVAVACRTRVRSIGERLERLIRATGTFLEQAQPIYRMWLREPMLTGPWAEAGATYGARWGELMRAALGPLADDRDAMAVLRAVSEPTFFDRLRAGTRTTSQVCELIAALIVPWFEARPARASRAATRRS